jgi:hypothetical protein
MNAQLSHQMAQLRQQDLHRAGERARAARGIRGESRLTALCQRILRTRSSSRPQPQPQPQAGRPVASVTTRV